MLYAFIFLLFKGILSGPTPTISAREDTKEEPEHVESGQSRCQQANAP